MPLGETASQPEVSLPTRGMLVVGGFVLAISVAAFFRVPLLPTIGEELALSPTDLGLLTTVFAIGRLATDIPAGRLADRLSSPAMLGLAGGALAVGSLVFGLAPTGTWALAASLVLGIASATANTSGMTYFSTAAPRAQRGMAMAGFSAALLGGQALGPLLGGVLGDGFGWRTALLAASVVGLVVALVGSRLRLADEAPGSPDDEPSAHGVGEPEEQASEHDVVLQRAVLYAVPFASFFALGALPQTLVPILGDARYAFGPSSIGLALGLGGACRLVGSFVGGHVADTVSRKASLVPGLVLFGLGAGSFALDLGPWGWVAGIVMISLGSYGIGVSATMLADLAGGRGVGRRLGPYRFVGDIGLIAGPVVTAMLYERVGARLAAGVVAALLLAVALTSAVLLHETHDQRTT